MNSENDSSDINIYPLSPQPNPENTKHYTNTLDKAIDHELISNIAITGSYGAGKSTIIETYIAEHTEKTCIKISLAEFAPEKHDETPVAVEEEKDIQRQEIERSILQQIFYQKSADDLPNSRFHRIKTVDPDNLHTNAMVLALLLIGLFFIFKDGALTSFIEFWTSSIQNPQKQELIQGTLSILFWIAFAHVFFIAIHKFLSVLSSTKRLNLKLETIGEIAVDNTGSVLNLYFDEILYFFEQTDVDVVFIEDLDRFEGLRVELFTKFREINHLLNASLKSKKRQINFVYALKDDLFKKDGERTKFFDFIIPVIPFVNHSNAGTQLWDGLEKYQSEVGRDFVFNVSQYVSEMRIIYNILNEFGIYLQNLRQYTESFEEHINEQKLLAFIVYKNVFPVDFSKLNMGEGDVYSMLQSRHQILEKVIEDENIEIRKGESELKRIEHLVARDTAENKKLFFIEVLDVASKSHQGITNIKVNNVQHTLAAALQLNDMKFVDQVLEAESIQVHNNRGWQNITPIGELKNLFEERENSSSLVSSANQIKAKISSVRAHIKSIRSLSLVELLDQYPEQNDNLYEIVNGPKSADNQSSKVAVNKNDLMVYLVSKGYIDKDYNHYLTYYHSSSPLSLPDRKFISFVRGETTGNDFASYELESPEEVLKELRDQHYSQREVWNYSLVHYLLVERKNIQIGALIDGFKEDHASLYFIIDYSLRYSNVAELIKYISKRWDSFFSDFLANDFDESLVEDFVINMINTLDNSHWEGFNTNSSVRDYFETCPNLIEILDRVEFIDQLPDLFSKLNIKLTKLDLMSGIASKESELLKIIIEGDFYELNNSMVNLLTSNLCPQSKALLKTNNLSTILEGECGVIKDRVISEFENYLERVYSKLEKQVESESFLLRLLNDKVIDGLSTAEKHQILQRQTVQFSDIGDIEESLWHVLFELRLVLPTWMNVGKYFIYSEYKIDTTLLASLSDHDFVSKLCNQKLRYQALDELDDKDRKVTRNLNRAIVNQMDIQIELYDMLIEASCSLWFMSMLANLGESKFEVLIKYRKLIFDQSNFDGLIEISHSLALEFLNTNYTKLIAAMQEKEVEFSDPEFFSILLISSGFDDNQKRELISLVDREFISKLSLDVNLTPVIAALLLVETNEIKYYLLCDLMGSEFISLEEKLGVLSNQLEYLGHFEDLDGLLQLLGNGYERIITQGSGPMSFTQSDAAINFFNALKSSEHKWVNDYQMDAGKNKDKIKAFAKKYYP